jgi:cellulose synthase/poly-beta-1,6-N-acetylglucosamine synthase-like glycosyltransferase
MFSWSEFLLDASSFLLVALAVLLAIPVAVFLLEIVAAITLPARRPRAFAGGAARKQIAVIVPAHNEGRAILPTIEDIKGQLQPGDRLVVVADNCTDDTAAVASAAGAEVIERHDSNKCGKGYALDYALKHLSLKPPETIICIDADCRVAADTVERLAAVCAATGRPIQALDLMTTHSESPINHRVAEFAWRVKNWVRPLGLSALGLPCHLMGTGMTFPWELIRAADVADGSLIEDVRLGLNLARAGRPPLFCPSASVTSHFASSSEGAMTQRRRWEEGSIKIILSEVPRLLYTAIRDRNLGLLALTLDLIVPPLTLLMILAVVVVLVSAGATLIGVPSTAFFVSAAGLAALAIAVTLSWLTYGRDVLPLASVFLIVKYAAGKIPLYGKIISNRTASPWLRTDRSR